MTASVLSASAGAAKDASFRQRLKAESGDRHERLDRAFEGMSTAADPALYHRFIRVNHACHAVIEPVLAASPTGAVLPASNLRLRTQALAADMADMGLDPLVPTAFPMPAPDLCAAIGIAYVIEGSLLGARFLYRRMAGRERERGWEGMSLHYLAASDGPDTFRAFMTEASRLALDEGSRGRAVRAANATFDYFLQAVRAAEAGTGADARGSGA